MKRQKCRDICRIQVSDLRLIVSCRVCSSNSRIRSFRRLKTSQERSSETFRRPFLYLFTRFLHNKPDLRRSDSRIRHLRHCGSRLKRQKCRNICRIQVSYLRLIVSCRVRSSNSRIRSFRRLKTSQKRSSETFRRPFLYLFTHFLHNKPSALTQAKISASTASGEPGLSILTPYSSAPSSSRISSCESSMPAFM